MKIEAISLPNAKYLKHEGEKVNVKVTIRIIDNFPMIYMRDFEFFSFQDALKFLQNVVETEVVSEQVAA